MTDNIFRDMDESDLQDELWDAFDKMSRKDRIEWLLELECVFETVRGWDKKFLISEIERLKDRED